MTFFNSWDKANDLTYFEEIVKHFKFLTPNITLWGHFEVPYFKLPNGASVASASSYVRTGRRVRNSQKCNYTRLPCLHMHRLYFKLTPCVQCTHFLIPWTDPGYTVPCSHRPQKSSLLPLSSVFCKAVKSERFPFWKYIVIF